MKRFGSRFTNMVVAAVAIPTAVVTAIVTIVEVNKVEEVARKTLKRIERKVR